MLYNKNNNIIDIDFSNMGFSQILDKIKELRIQKEEEKKNVIIKNDKKILKYEKLKIGLINISTINDVNSKREIKKKDYILELFDSDKDLNILICPENNITD